MTTIVYLADAENKYLKVSAPEIASFADDNDFIEAILTATKTCGTEITKTIAYEDILVNTNDFYLEGDDMFINPLFFGLTDYTDGVYKITLRFNKESSWVIISNCIFVDVTYKCLVASLLKNIIGENKAVGYSEKTSTIIHLIHYALFNGSNCGCNCSELCVLFNELTNLLTNIDAQTLNDCGC
jgi:hypothetical protein